VSPARQDSWEEAGEGLQEAVAHGVAAALVDLGEAVHVGQDHRDRAHAHPGQAGQRAQADVGQPQLVVERLGPQGQPQTGDDVRAGDRHAGHPGHLLLAGRDGGQLAGQEQHRDGQGGRVPLEAHSS